METIQEKISYYGEYNVLLKKVKDNLIEARTILDRTENWGYDQHHKYAQIIHDQFDINNKIKSNDMFIDFLKKDLKAQEDQKQAMVKEMNDNYYKLAAEARGLLVNDIPENNRMVIKNKLDRYEKNIYDIKDYFMLKDCVSKTKQLLEKKEPILKVLGQ